MSPTRAWRTPQARRRRRLRGLPSLRRGGGGGHASSSPLGAVVGPGSAAAMVRRSRGGTRACAPRVTTRACAFEAAGLRSAAPGRARWIQAQMEMGTADASPRTSAPLADESCLPIEFSTEKSKPPLTSRKSLKDYGESSCLISNSASRSELIYPEPSCDALRCEPITRHADEDSARTSRLVRTP